VTPEELAGVRTDLLDLATAAGMPEPVNDRARTVFDLGAAKYLHSRLDMTPGEASQRPVWSYFGLVLVPDICAWRYPAQARGYFDERFRCADVTRHTLSRLWLRAHLLHDRSCADPYELVGVLGENDMDQILSRRKDLAATPALVRTITRAHRDDPRNRGTTFDREVLRDSLKRLLRLAAFMNFDGRTARELDDLVISTRGLSRETLGRTVAG
jgi:hypothetical protein